MAMGGGGHGIRRPLAGGRQLAAGSDGGRRTGGDGPRVLARTRRRCPMGFSIFFFVFSFLLIEAGSQLSLKMRHLH